MAATLAANALWRWCAVVVVSIAALLSDAHAGTGETRRSPILSVHGPITNVTARYLDREIRRATDERAELVLVRLDTPGGLESSTREITQTLLGSPLPVVLYVSPSGARAASAGMFIVLAANVAAMAPGTTIGAAHPVGLGRADPVLEAKVVNDAAALVRAIAAIRHRNGAWAERAVRESVSASSDEAREQGVVDLLARDVPDLMQQLDGRTVTTSDGEHTLHTAGLPLEERPMLTTERILQLVSNPNVAYLLFLFGLIAIIAELYHPGAVIPGTLGGVSLLLALVAFGNLPVSWAGVLLVLLAIGLFVAELHTGVGAFAVGALVALVLGSLMLYGPGPVSPVGGAARVSPWVIALMSALVAAFFLLVVRATLRARRLAVRTGISALVGRPGIATSEIDPAGTVRVDSEVWSAESDAGPIHEGERVEVIGAAGVTLRVTRPAPEIV